MFIPSVNRGTTALFAWSSQTQFIFSRICLQPCSIITTCCTKRQDHMPNKASAKFKLASLLIWSWSSLQPTSKGRQQNSAIRALQGCSTVLDGTTDQATTQRAMVRSRSCMLYILLSEDPLGRGPLLRMWATIPSSGLKLGIALRWAPTAFCISKATCTPDL